MSLIQGREPAAFFHYFEEISAIPRMSYHEEAIADYLVAFAKERGLEYIRDASNNVFIRMAASAGYEDRAPVLLQGHTDMVCEKNSDVDHDFLTEPLDLYIDGDYLRARGTTLGADDGVAVAMMLAVLDGALLEHPAVECLFTSSEEVGLDGAKGFDYSNLKARRMINLDSETLGEIIAGCAGGIRSEITLATSPVPFKGSAMRIAIAGLSGGHSGENIHEGRANANKLMGRLLAEAVTQCGAKIVSVNGGSKDNAIPRECEAIIAVADTGAAETVITDTAVLIARELIELDRRFTVTCEDVAAEAFMLDDKDTARVVALLCGVANGVLDMNRKIEGLVEFSRNLGVVKTNFDAVSMTFSSRSSMESRLDASVAELDAIARVVGAVTKHYARYPGWEFASVSPLRDAYAKAYHSVTGKDVVVKVIHAGLECGIIFASVPGMDIISIAPDLQNLHSPEGALNLPSVEVFWQTFVELMKNL